MMLCVLGRLHQRRRDRVKTMNAVDRSALHAVRLHALETEAFEGLLATWGSFWMVRYIRDDAAFFLSLGFEES